MKQLTTVTKIIGAVLILALIAGCQTVSSNQAELAASKKEFLLARSGFKVITVTTPKQQQAINGLAQYRLWSDGDGFFGRLVRPAGRANLLGLKLRLLEACSAGRSAD